VILCSKVKHVENIINFVDLDKEEEEGSMPIKSMLKALSK
jgi:hypothetical protein